MSHTCEICFRNFFDEDSFLWHVFGAQHGNSLELMELIQQRGQTSVVVSSIPPSATPQIISAFFSRFGLVEKCTINDGYIIVEFKDEDPVEHLLNNAIYLNQWKLEIRRSRIDSYLYTRQNIEAAIALHEPLGTEKSFETQLVKLLYSIQRHETEMRRLVYMVCSSLSKILMQSFPKCQLRPFGSSVTGLSLIGSDLDVFLDIGEPIVENEEMGGEEPPWTPTTVFKEVRKHLYRRPTIFTKIVPISGAKIPIIKFHHIPSEMNCDISFKHGFGVHNSKLIKHLMTLDGRIKPLILVLKYWAKKLDISGSGKINNYSLVMLIIFYLQQPSVNLLPKITDIQKVREEIYIRGWQVNFNKGYPSTSRNCSSSILELLEGFFEFYCDFDFARVVICPSWGVTWPRAAFKDAWEDEFESFKLTRDACLQDPIQRDHNIVSEWRMKDIEGLQLSCLRALKICRDSRESPLDIIPELFDPAGLPDNFVGRNFESTQNLEEDSSSYTVYMVLAGILLCGMAIDFMAVWRR